MVINKEYGSFVSIVEAAQICGYAPDTVRTLIGLRAGVYLSANRGFRKIYTKDARYLAKYHSDPNTCLPAHIKRPLFAKHDDGRWWPMLSRDDAMAKGKQRYFEGTPCESGHTVKRYTKTGKCVDCCQREKGKPTSKEKLDIKNESSSAGCKIPSVPAY